MSFTATFQTSNNKLKLYLVVQERRFLSFCKKNTMDNFLQLLHLSPVINRPGVSGAVLQTALWLTDSLFHWFSHPFPPNFLDIINSKPLELESWHFREFSSPTMCPMSHVTCHASHVRCHVSYVRCHVSGVFFFSSDEVVEFVSWGSVINGAHPV